MADGRSKPKHFMWLNRNLGPKSIVPKTTVEGPRGVLPRPRGISSWIRAKFIERFYGERPHPFIVAMERPSREVLLGYEIEHQSFLKNWVKVPFSIVFCTDREEAVKYELENIAAEFLGFKGISFHYELS
jgi:pyrroloquinoline-quinone synthase